METNVPESPVVPFVTTSKQTKEPKPEGQSIVQVQDRPDELPLLEENDELAAKVADLPVAEDDNLPENESSVQLGDRSAPVDIASFARSIPSQIKAPKGLLQRYLYVRAGNENIFNQRRHTIYYDPGDQALYGSSISGLRGIENRLLMSWNNHSSATAKYSETYTIGFTTTTSTEVGAEINLAPSFEGVSVGGVTVGYKRITTQETQKSFTKTVEVEVPANSTVYFYQVRYHIKTDVYFTLDAWNELSIAGSNGGYHKQWATILSHIDATEYLTTSEKLTQQTTAQMDTQRQEPPFGQHIRKFENLTGRAKDTLRRIGIDGSQTGRR